MRALLKVLWGDDQKARDALRLRLATDPTKLFREKGIIEEDSETKIIIHFDQKDVFNVPIPLEPQKPGGKDDEPLLTLASHLIRCCADGC